MSRMDRRLKRLYRRRDRIDAKIAELRLEQRRLYLQGRAMSAWKTRNEGGAA